VPALFGPAAAAAPPSVLDGGADARDAAAGDDDVSF